MIVEKLLGVLSIVGGFFFIFFFPETAIWQSSYFTKTALIIGILLVLVGIYLIRV